MSTRRALLIGEAAEGGLVGSIQRGFEANGCEVDLVSTPTALSRLGRRAALRVPALASRFRRAIDAQLDDKPRPDVVVVVKGTFFDHRLIERLRRLSNGPVVCWNPDSPFDGAPTNSGGGIPSLVSAYDLYVTWSQVVGDLLRDRAQRVAVIPFGYDPSISFPERGGDSTEQGRLTFVGTWTPDRETWVRSLRRFDPVVYGSFWPSGIADVRPEVTGSAFRQAIGGASHCLNFLRPQNANSHNMRSFEIPACGGRQVAPLTPDHTRLLGGTGARFFSSRDELDEVLASTWDVVVPAEWRARHTYGERVKQLVEACEHI